MDMISLLSDDLVFRILSFVSTKDVMAISCVSKRWRPIWNLVSSLEFDDTNHDYNYKRFTQFVYKTLLLNKSPTIEKLNLNLGPNCDDVDVRTWIDASVSRGLRELEVKIWSDLGLGLGSGPSVSLPSSLFTCKTLESLTLINCLLVSDVVPSCFLPCLKSLGLKEVSYESLAKILSGSSNLEILKVVVEEEDQGGENIIVAAPCLRMLDLFDSREESEGGVTGVYVIKAPCVEDLKIADDFVYESRRIENMPNLVKAHVDITQGVTHEFLRALASAQSLYLCVSLLSEAPSLNIFFYRLVDLELNTCAQGWWEFLTYMLQNSPKLASLKLTDEHESLSSQETPDCWKEPSSIPESLETFEWSGYKGRQGDLEMATYVIKNATRLKTATFSPENDSDYESKFRMLKDLVSVSLPSTSPSFQLFFD